MKTCNTISYGFVWLPVLLAVLGVLAASGAAYFVFKGQTPKREELSTRINQVYEEIKQDVHVSASDISQCRTMEIGHKACGGPGSYLVYSTQSTDGVRLATLVETYNKLGQEIEKAREAQGIHLSSTCNLEQQPLVVLEGGNCVAQ